MTTLKAKKTQADMSLKLGRFGHLALYSEYDNSIYLFAGEQQGSNTKTDKLRDMRNDTLRLDLKSGLFERVIMRNMGSIKRRIYATGFIVG